MDIKEYYERNKDWLQKLAQSGDTIVRAMALVILKEGGEQSSNSYSVERSEEPKKVDKKKKETDESSQEFIFESISINLPAVATNSSEE